MYHSITYYRDKGIVQLDDGSLWKITSPNYHEEISCWHGRPYWAGRGGEAPIALNLRPSVLDSSDLQMTLAHTDWKKSVTLKLLQAPNCNKVAEFRFLEEGYMQYIDKRFNSISLANFPALNPKTQQDATIIKSWKEHDPIIAGYFNRSVGGRHNFSEGSFGAGSFLYNYRTGEYAFVFEHVEERDYGW